MRIVWGALFQSFPLAEWGEGRICLNCEKTQSSGRSFRAFLLNRREQITPKSLLTVGCLFNIQG